jgi:hypothetical protein
LKTVVLDGAGKHVLIVTIEHVELSIRIIDVAPYESSKLPSAT